MFSIIALANISTDAILVYMERLNENLENLQYDLKNLQLFCYDSVCYDCINYYGILWSMLLHRHLNKRMVATEPAKQPLQITGK